MYRIRSPSGTAVSTNPNAKRPMEKGRGEKRVGSTLAPNHISAKPPTARRRAGASAATPCDRMSCHSSAASSRRLSCRRRHRARKPWGGGAASRSRNSSTSASRLCSMRRHVLSALPANGLGLSCEAALWPRRLGDTQTIPNHSRRGQPARQLQALVSQPAVRPVVAPRVALTMRLRALLGYARAPWRRTSGRQPDESDPQARAVPLVT